MSTAKYTYLALKDELASIYASLLEHKVFLVVVFAALLAVILTQNIIPPSRFSIATAIPDSGYAKFVKESAPYFHKQGIGVKVLDTNGSVENLRLVTNDSAIDAALIQGGLDVDDQALENVVSLGSVGYEPIWIFTHSKLGNIHSLQDIVSQKIGVGPKQGGTQVVAGKIFSENDIDIDRSKNFIFDSYQNNLKDFENGRLDGIVIVSPISSTTIQNLLKDNRYNLFNFQFAKAYEKKFSFIKEVVLPASSIDIANQVPKSDITLIATTTSLVVKKSMHPDLQLAILMAVKNLFLETKYLFFSSRNEMPRYIDPAFKLSEAAKEYYESGLPFGLKHLPYRLAGIIDRLWFYFAAFIAVLYPLSKLNFGHRFLRHHAETLRIFRQLFAIDEQMYSQNNLTKIEFRILQKKLNTIKQEMQTHKAPVGSESDAAILHLLVYSLDRQLSFKMKQNQDRGISQ